MALSAARRTPLLFCVTAVAAAACGLELEAFSPAGDGEPPAISSSSGSHGGGSGSSSGQGEPNAASSSGNVASSSGAGGGDGASSSSSGEPGTSSSSGEPGTSSSSGEPGSSSSSGGPLGVCLPEASPYAFTTLPLDAGQFSHDVIAEAATTRGTTSSALDGASYVLFSASYAQLRGNNPKPLQPEYTTPTHAFQLQPFTQANAVHVAHEPPNASVVLQLPTNSGRALSLLGFSTEGASALQITLNYADGSAPSTLSPITLRDWFTDEQGIAKINGFDRVKRSDERWPTVSFANTRGPNLYVVDLVKPYARCASPVASIRIERIADQSGENARAWLFAVAASE